MKSKKPTARFLVSDTSPETAASTGEPAPGPSAGYRLLVLLAIAAAAVIGGYIGRSILPSPAQQASFRVRPIVQIVRPQAGLPSLADTIDRLCPSVATITLANGAVAPPAGKSKTAGLADVAVPAFAVSADGWLLSSGPLPQGSTLQAVFGDGRQAAISEVRSDPVSGLVLAKTDSTGLAPLAFVDQSFAHVGDFGFTILSPNGSGCSAAASMIGSDFLVDREAQGIFLHLQSDFGALPPGAALLASDGTVLGVESNVADNTLIPAPLVAVIVDELIRNSPSPIAEFGFRAVDFTPELAARVGNSRQRGVGVALVQSGSAAAKAGLEAGDAVAAVDSAPVSSASELSRALDAVTGSATLDVIRDAQPLTVTVKRSTKVNRRGG